MKKILLIILPLLIISCNNDLYENVPDQIDPSEKESMLEFKYKENVYVTSYSQTDSGINYENSEVESIMNKLSENTNLAIFIHENGLLEYFDSHRDVEKYLEMTNNNSETVQTRAGYVSTLNVYTKTKCKGTKATINIDDTYKSASVANLNTIGMDQKICSFKMHSNGNMRTILTLFSEHNFRGYSITFQVANGMPGAPNPLTVNDLGTYIVQVPLILRWDNYARSLKFYK